MLVRADGSIHGTVGGGALEHKLRELCIDVIREATPRKVVLNLASDLGMTCGGAVEAFIEPLSSPDHLIIFGGGHIAEPMASIAKTLGFRVTVVDDRADWIREERFPSVDERVHLAFQEFLNERTFTSQDYLLIITRDHVHDFGILERVVGAPWKWLGMIGSVNKSRKAFSDLRAQGIPEDALSRVECPVGFDIGAVSPEEIAISIAARLIQVRQKGPEAPKAVSIKGA